MARGCCGCITQVSIVAGHAGHVFDGKLYVTRDMCEEKWIPKELAPPLKSVPAPRLFFTPFGCVWGVVVVVVVSPGVYGHRIIVATSRRQQLSGTAAVTRFPVRHSCIGGGVFLEDFRALATCVVQPVVIDA